MSSACQACIGCELTHIHVRFCELFVLPESQPLCLCAFGKTACMIQQTLPCALHQVIDGQTLDRMESGRSASTSKAAGKRNADRRKEAASDGDALAFADLVAEGACPPV